ncbi:MAG: helix-turn-helix domain-containing protein, partial [Terrisporobacter sp.]
MRYDINYKMRAVEYQIEGHTYKETCKVFKVSETTLTRWIKRALEEIKDIPKEDIIYIDETGIEEYIYREYARAPKGEKVYAKIKHFKGTQLILSPLFYS